MKHEVRCPACATVFVLDPGLLRPDDTRVRCGECQMVFNADEHLVDPQPAEFAETGVGWVVVASRDARPSADDDGGAPRYVAAGDDSAWDAIAAGSADAVNAATGPKESTADDDKNAETALFEPEPVVLTVVGGAATDEPASDVVPADQSTGDPGDMPADGPADEPADAAESENAAAADVAPGHGAPHDSAGAPKAAGDDWQALLAEIDTLPDVDELARGETLAGVAAGDGTQATTADNNTDAAPDDELTLVADDELTLVSDDTADALTLAVDEPVADPSSAADHDPLPLSDFGTGETPVEPAAAMKPSDADIMQEFTVSESDFLPADDAFVEAVIDSFVLEEGADSATPDDAFDIVLESQTDSGDADTDRPAIDDYKQPPAASATSDSDDEAVDTSGIFVSETLLPEHESRAATADYVPAATGAEISDDTSRDDDEIFETAIGLAQEPPAATFWTRYGGLGAALLALLLVVQALHQYRTELATLGSLNPLYTAVYGERLQPAWNIRELCFEQRDASAAADTMRIVGRVRNRGSQPLPYPQLHVTLLSRFDDGTGNVPLAHRLLAPSEYLLSGPPGDRIGAGQAFDAQALLRDPGPDASGYELEVCYRRDNGRLACNSGC